MINIKNNKKTIYIMSEKSEKDLKEKQEEPVEATPQEQASAETTVEAEEPTAEEKLQKELDDTKAELEKSKKEYMFLLAEFDNFRKRTLKEKSELIKNAAEGAMKDLLPVLEEVSKSGRPLLIIEQRRGKHKGRRQLDLQQICQIS